MIGAVIDGLNLGLSGITTATRFWAGWRGTSARQRPERPVVLYEFEGCPYCRIAREAVSALQLDAEIRPCPKNGTRYRPRVTEMGGKAQFPYLIDPNTDVAMYESADVARYLYKTYGGRVAPLTLWLGALNGMLASLGLIFRLGQGRAVMARTKEIAEPLHFWGVEADPRARLVRERLCSLEIPYVLHTGQPETGASPALHDPGTGERHQGFRAIRRYLTETYAD